MITAARFFLETVTHANVGGMPMSLRLCAMMGQGDTLSPLSPVIVKPNLFQHPGQFSVYRHKILKQVQDDDWKFMP